MSFSSDIKSELTSIENLSSCCYHAQVYGLVLFAHFTGYNLSFKTENSDVFDFYCKSVSEYTGAQLNIKKTGTKKLIVSVDDKENKEKVFNKFGHQLTDASVRINHANFQDECCMASFLRGAFLSCGSVSNPDKAYHLEFVVPYKKLSNDLMTVFNELDLNPKYIQRKGNHVVYFKDSERIEDFLAYIGAQNASLYLMNIKIEKDVKNKVNRKLNFEMHNLEKTVSASNCQIEAINYIKSTTGLGILPEHLKKLAVIRLENPDSTLTELQDLYGENISKSGVKHRLDKIREIAEKTRQNSNGD